MSPELFTQLSQENYNRIPVFREVLADLETPLSVYATLALCPNSFLLESVETVEKWGRYSIIGLPAREHIKVFGERVMVVRDGALVEDIQTGDPLVFVRDYKARFRVPKMPGLPAFSGGLVGYVGYDMVRYVEPKLKQSQPKDELGLPDIYLMLAEELVIFDNFTGKLTLVVHADPERRDAYQSALSRLDELETMLEQQAPVLPKVDLTHKAELNESDLHSGMGREGYEAGVQKIRDYCLAGDIMQVVLSQRLSMPFNAEPISLYRALRSINPSPYMFYLDLDGFQVVGASPEILVRQQEGEVTIRPIAGTRPRGKTEAEDLALEEEMMADPKELAEHLMLIDLGRNDCGRVAQTGTVHLTEQMIVERFSHVMHITSNVVGKIRDDLDSIDVLKAAHPAGTLSGAPKIRAMEIIDELEPVKRGIYAGAVGYLGWDDQMDMAIAIRTAVIKDNQMYVQAGAGIVADSVPANEWDETMNKARALLRAAAVVQAGEESR